MPKVLHASKSGYFPFCIGSGGNFGPNEGQFGGGVYPVGMSLDDLMTAYWRVSSWEVSIFTLTTIVQPEFYGAEGNTSLKKVITNEEELVCTTGFEISGGQFEDDASFSFHIWPEGRSPSQPLIDTPYSVKKSGNLYWPRIFFLGDADYLTENYKQGATIDYFPGAVVNSGILNFMGYEIQLKTSAEATPMAQPLNLTITPATYRSFS